MRKKKAGYNWYKLLLCGLVFFVIGGTAFCMVAESKESAEKRAEAEAERKAEEAAERKAEEAARVRKESLSLAPGVPAGTLEPDHLMMAHLRIHREYLIYSKNMT